MLLRGVEDAKLSIKEGDIFVLAQEIVSKAEGRMVRLRDVVPSPRAIKLALQSDKDARFCEVVLWDTQRVVRVRNGLMIVETKQG